MGGKVSKGPKVNLLKRLRSTKFLRQNPTLIQDGLYGRVALSTNGGEPAPTWSCDADKLPDPKSSKFLSSPQETSHRLETSTNSIRESQTQTSNHLLQSREPTRRQNTCAKSTLPNQLSTSFGYGTSQHQSAARTAWRTGAE